MEEERKRLSLPYRTLCVGVMSYSKLMRCRNRLKNNERLVHKTGPAKFAEVDMKKFREDIMTLRHGRKRTAGVGALHSKWGKSLSRRVINEAVRLYRDEISRDKRAMQRRLKWHVGGLVWAVDDTELSIDGIKMNVHNVRDIASRYTFRPSVGAIPKGIDVAQNLELLFHDHGAPLFLKRDNGGNLNSSEVDRVLERFGVIALNSPKYYPPYNGAVERCQREMKEEIQKRYEGGCGDFLAMAQLSAHDLNHVRRDCLQGSSACAVLESGRIEMKKYNMKKRKEVRNQLMALVGQISENTDGKKPKDFDTIWRVAVETWLREHGLLTVLNNKKCNPIYHEIESH